jgi:hypothetical protein
MKMRPTFPAKKQWDSHKTAGPFLRQGKKVAAT